MKKSLLIISHGSRRTASNKEVFALTAHIQELSAELSVECAFLEITEPTVQQKIDELADAGVTDIQIFPYFLAAGSHVTVDIPREIKLAQAKHPELTFSQLSHLGSLTELPEIIAQTIKTHS